MHRAENQTRAKIASRGRPERATRGSKPTALATPRTMQNYNSRTEKYTDSTANDHQQNAKVAA